MFRTYSIAMMTAALVAAFAPFTTPGHAQIGNIFSDRPRPPGNVPRGEPIEPEEEEVPDLPPQGRLLPTPIRPPPGQGVAPPGAVQSQPLPPPPGVAPNVPGIANNPPNAPGAVPGQAPNTVSPGVASVPPAANPLPGLPSGQRQPRNAPPAPATLQPGDEIVTEPPAQKIPNKQAVFSGLDKITGRIINFDADMGETVQFGALRITPRACYTRPATEATNTDAFVEVDELTLQKEVKRIFSGWMFAASPGLHGVEHPVYDVWLTDCKAPDATVAQQFAPKPVSAPQQKRQPAPQRPPGLAPPGGAPPQPRQPSLGVFPPFRQ